MVRIQGIFVNRSGAQYVHDIEDEIIDSIILNFFPDDKEFQLSLTNGEAHGFDDTLSMVGTAGKRKIFDEFIKKLEDDTFKRLPSGTRASIVGADKDNMEIISCVMILHNNEQLDVFKAVIPKTFVESRANCALNYYQQKITDEEFNELIDNLFEYIAIFLNVITSYNCESYEKLNKISRKYCDSVIGEVFANANEALKNGVGKFFTKALLYIVWKKSYLINYQLSELFIKVEI